MKDHQMKRWGVIKMKVVVKIMRSLISAVTEKKNKRFRKFILVVPEKMAS